MGFLEILLVSIGMAMDAFAVSICKGLSMKEISLKKAIIVGLWFGIFQAIMPFLGFTIGSFFQAFIKNIDHWIAFILLGIIGFNMIKESFSKENEKFEDNITFKLMLILSIATSIDALTLGIAYAYAYGNNNAMLTFSCIGIITFILSTIGVGIGNKFGNKFENKAKFTGGCILVILGFKILFEHLQISL